MRILFLTGGAPWPTQLGVNQRTNLLWRALRECGAVDTVIISRYVEVSGGEREHLRDAYGVTAYFRQQGPGDRWPWRLLRPLSRPLAERLGTRVGGLGVWYETQADIAGWLAERLRECRYDLIIGRYLRALASSGALAYRPVVLDLDDFDCGTQRSRLQRPGLSALQRCAVRRRVRQIEKVVPRLLTRCEHIWVASREDQGLLRSYPASILPNIPFEPDGAGPLPACPPRAQSNSILMVGSLRHTVNVDAIERFLQAVWPRVHAAVAGSEFRIVGYGMTDSQKRRWGAVAGVVPVGFAEELKDEYDRCAFVVVPIFEGGGTKIKVLEALRYGRTVVAASHSCRGYADVLQHLDALWIAPDEEAIVNGCKRLLQEPALRAGMADRGRHLVERHYSYERFRHEVRATVESLAAAGQGVTRRTAP